MAAGFRCSDGIVLCADTELTYTDILKYQGSKIRVYEREGLAAAITGAGDWEYLRMAFEKVLDRIDELPSTLDAIQSDFERIILDIHARHIPLFPREPKPGIDVLLAVRCEGDGLALIRSSDTAIARSSTFELLGTGSLLARSFADNLYAPDIRMKECVFLAAYVMRLAKRYVPAVGGSSDIVALPFEGQMRNEPAVNITDLEQLYAELHSSLRPVLLAFPDVAASLQDSLNMQRMSDEEFERKLMIMVEAIRQLRERQKSFQSPFRFL